MHFPFGVLGALIGVWFWAVVNHLYLPDRWRNEWYGFALVLTEVLTIVLAMVVGIVVGAYVEDKLEDD